MYNRELAVEYANEWALGRNPRYYSFNGIGGDCTNFVSQCLYAGGAPMNYEPVMGWYYISSTDRTAAWTGVEYFYNFLMRNEGRGPYAQEVTASEMEPGDVIQLSFLPGAFGHTLLVTDTDYSGRADKILIATHSDDSRYRPLSSYYVHDVRYLKIFARS